MAHGPALDLRSLPDSMFTAFRCFTGECAAWAQKKTDTVGGSMCCDWFQKVNVCIYIYIIYILYYIYTYKDTQTSIV